MNQQIYEETINRMLVQLAQKGIMKLVIRDTASAMRLCIEFNAYIDLIQQLCLAGDTPKNTEHDLKAWEQICPTTEGRRVYYLGQDFCGVHIFEMPPASKLHSIFKET